MVLSSVDGNQRFKLSLPMGRFLPICWVGDLRDFNGKIRILQDIALKSSEGLKELLYWTLDWVTRGRCSSTKRHLFWWDSKNLIMIVQYQ